MDMDQDKLRIWMFTLLVVVLAVGTATLLKVPGFSATTALLFVVVGVVGMLVYEQWEPTPAMMAASSLAAVLVITMLTTWNFALQTIVPMGILFAAPPFIAAGRMRMLRHGKE